MKLWHLVLFPSLMLGMIVAKPLPIVYGGDAFRSPLPANHGHYSSSLDFTGKWLKIDLSCQQLDVYNDQRLLRVMPISSGVPPKWTTPDGTFWIFRKVADDHMKGGIRGSSDSWDVEHVPWAQYIYGGIAIHGAWWNHQFGVPRSHGCIQLPTRTFNPDPGDIRDDAKWLYYYTEIGTPVVIIGQTPPITQVPLQYPDPGPPVALPTFARYGASLTR